MNCPYCNAQCKKRWTTSQPQYEPDGFVWACPKCEWDQENNPVLVDQKTVNEKLAEYDRQHPPVLCGERISKFTTDAEWEELLETWLKRRLWALSKRRAAFKAHVLCYTLTISVGGVWSPIKVSIHHVDPSDPAFNPDEFFSPFGEWADAVAG